MNQLKGAFVNYPWLFPLLVCVLLAGVGLAVVVNFILKKREQKNMQNFVVLADSKEEIESKQQPVSLSYEDDDKTMSLFDYSDTELKSYQLTLYDLNSPGVVYRLNLNDRVVIGRRASCDVCIPNGTLSGEHCEIILKNSRMYLHDLNSTNGTFLNGNSSRITEEELTSGSIFEMGSVRLKAELAIFQM